MRKLQPILIITNLLLALFLIITLFKPDLLHLEEKADTLDVHIENGVITDDTKSDTKSDTSTSPDTKTNTKPVDSKTSEEMPKLLLELPIMDQLIVNRPYGIDKEYYDLDNTFAVETNDNGQITFAKMSVEDFNKRQKQTTDKPANEYLIGGTTFYFTDYLMEKGIGHIMPQVDDWMDETGMDLVLVWTFEYEPKTALVPVWINLAIFSPGNLDDEVIYANKYLSLYNDIYRDIRKDPDSISKKINYMNNSFDE